VLPVGVEGQGRDRGLVCRYVLDPVGAELVHHHGPILGPHGDPPGRQAVGHLVEGLDRGEDVLDWFLLEVVVVDAVQDDVNHVRQ